MASSSRSAQTDPGLQQSDHDQDQEPQHGHLHDVNEPPNESPDDSLPAPPRKLAVLIPDRLSTPSPTSEYSADEDISSPTSARSASGFSRRSASALYDDMVSLPSPFVGHDENFDHFLTSFGGSLAGSNAAISRQSSLRIPNHDTSSTGTGGTSSAGPSIEALNRVYGSLATNSNRPHRIISEYVPSPIKVVNSNLRQNYEHNKDVLTGDKQSIPKIPKDGGSLLQVRKLRDKSKPCNSGGDTGYVPTIKQPQRSASEQIRPDASATLTDDSLKREYEKTQPQQSTGIESLEGTSQDTDLDAGGEPLKTYEAFSFEGIKSTWRESGIIGRGAFSKVSLATPSPRYVKQQLVENVQKYKVAIKVINMGPAGGASRSQIENGVKRELDILKSLRSPTLIRILAFNMDSEKALMVLPYYAGRDLFDFIGNNSALKPCMILRRLFAEIVDAVCYLHKNNIVHRDIKLENVLLRLTADEILKLGDKCHEYPYSIVSLTDFGLSRRIDPDNPTLSTRCGSDDYVPPEILMGQPYDGRETDSWALGVLLYGMLEKRLPFDPPKHLPAHRVRGRVAHRIAKVEWSWIHFQPMREATDPSPADREWLGGLEIVEGCLQRRNSRWLAVKEVADSPWVSDALHKPLLEKEAFEIRDLFDKEKA